MVKSGSERVLAGLNGAVLTLIGIVSFYPLWYVLVASFSTGIHVIAGDVWLLPVEPSLDAYAKVVAERGIWIGYLNSIYITGVGTMVSMALTIAGAYALSKRRLRGRVTFTFLVVVTMWFDAGIIPTFLNLRDLGLYNSRAALILGFAVIPFYVVILRTFFQSVPAELEESAKMDGAGDISILTRIYLPVSKASVATIALYYGVARWNGYFWSMILLKDESKIPLQVVLKKIVVEMQMQDEWIAQVDSFVSYSKETVIFAIIVVAVIPVLLVYPFVQRYFAKGIMIGSLKG